jgi:hypothetical protein
MTTKVVVVVVVVVKADDIDPVLGLRGFSPVCYFIPRRRR